MKARVENREVMLPLVVKIFVSRRILMNSQCLRAWNEPMSCGFQVKSRLREQRTERNLGETRNFDTVDRAVHRKSDG